MRQSRKWTTLCKKRHGYWKQEVVIFIQLTGRSKWLRLDILFPPPWLLFPAKPPAPLPFSSFIFPCCHFYYSLLYCAAQMSTLYVKTKSAPPFCLSVLSALSLINHYPSTPTLSPASLPRLLTFSSQPPSCGHSSSFISVICRFPIPSLFYSVFLCMPLFFFPFSRDNRQALFGAIFSADSLWFMCPSSHLPKGHQGRAQKTQAVKHLFLASLQLFSLLSFLTCVSSPLTCLSFCLASTVGLGLSALPLSTHPTPSFTTTHSLILSFAHLEFVVYSSLVAALLQYLHSSPVRIV